MFWGFVIALCLAGFAMSGWVMAELELRDAWRAQEVAERDRDVAVGWTEAVLSDDEFLRALNRDAVVHPTLNLVSDESEFAEGAARAFFRQAEENDRA